MKKLVQRERVSVLPPALELLRKVESEIEKIWALPTEAEVRAQVKSLSAELARSNARAAEGPPTRLGLLDPDGIVAQWRAFYRDLSRGQRNLGMTFSPKRRIDSRMDACGM